MKTQIFEYKGHVAAIMPENGVYINDPRAKGQLGTVISTTEIEITQNAKDLISKARRDEGSFSEIMLTKHADGSGSSIGLMGFGKHYMGTKDHLMIGRDCDVSVLDDCTVTEIEAPDDFKEFIDEE